MARWCSGAVVQWLVHRTIIYNYDTHITYIRRTHRNKVFTARYNR